jgi:NTP pyrophosphatase (non-canonical NTP hydrolase)
MTYIENLQKAMAGWVKGVLGLPSYLDKQKRARRVLEEAAELYQATGGSVAHAHWIVEKVFEKPVGEVPQEFAGVLLTLLALADSYDISLAEVATKEYKRITTIDPAIIQKKQEAKDAAGM